MKVPSHQRRQHNPTGAKAEVMLSSFATLLSSAVTKGVEHPLLSSANPTLSRLVSPNTNHITNIQPVSYPSLALKNRNGNNRNVSLSSEGGDPNKNAGIKNAPWAAQKLASIVTVDRSTVDSVPGHILKNLSDSLKLLIDSRLRSSLSALVRTMKPNKNTTVAAASGATSSMATNPPSSLDGVIGIRRDADVNIMELLLVTLDPIRITTVVTTFTVIPSMANGLVNPLHKSSNIKHEVDNASSRGIKNTSSKDDDSRVVTLPLVFEAVFDAKVLGKMVNLNIQAPGTITGALNPSDSLLGSVNVSFDTMTLLRSMMHQARVVVKKAFREAAIFQKKATCNLVGKSHSGSCISTGESQQHDAHEVSNGATSISSKPSTMQEALLTSYPNHLRKTVEHFLPAMMETSEDVSIEGFPSHLANTLISLSKGSSNDGSGEYWNSSKREGQENNNDGGCNGVKDEGALHHGLFSWIHNDEMVVNENVPKQVKPSMNADANSVMATVATQSQT